MQSLVIEMATQVKIGSAGGFEIFHQNFKGDIAFGVDLNL